MSKSFMDDLDLGFVKQNPWIIRDREQKRTAAAAAQAELERQMATDQQKSDQESDVEEIEYGPGYVKRIRDHFLALAKQVESSQSTPASSKRKISMDEEKNNSENKNESEVTSENSDENSTETSLDSEQKLDGNEMKNDSGKQNLQNDAAFTNQPKSMAALVMEQVEKIGQEFHRKTSITNTGHQLAEDEELLEEPITVKSIKERFEPNSNAKSEKRAKTDRYIASETRRDQLNMADEVEEVYHKDHMVLSLTIDHCGLDDGFTVNEFPIVEGIPRPPPTPFPHSMDILDFDSSIHSPGILSPPLPTSVDASVSLGSNSSTTWDGLDFETTIRPPPIPDTTPIRPPDYWVKKPRRIPSPTKRVIEDSADCSSIEEMKSILTKFQKNRAWPDVQQKKQEEIDQAFEILPNDPSPSVAPKYSYDDEMSQSEDSLDFLSTDDDEIVAEPVEKFPGRGDRLRPIKKRKIKFEIIGGGLVPGKTNLSQGPKFTGREIEFSQQPPRAYAYLEESFVTDTGEWVPGRELSLEQYQEIRDDLKRERYKKYLTSTPYYAFYEDEAAILADTMVTPLNYNGYYPPVTVDDVYVIKLRAPMDEPPLPPSHPPLLNPDWYVDLTIRPPPAYTYPTSQERCSVSTFAVPQN